MKKVLGLALAAALLLPVGTFAAAKKLPVTVDFQAGTNMVWVDCEPLPIDEDETVVPYIDDGCLMVPLRCAAEILGYKVIWDAEQPEQVQAGHLSFYANNNIATYWKPVLNLNRTTMSRPDGEIDEWKMPKAAKTIDGRMYVPVRALAELCGYKLSWDQERQTAAMQQKTREDIMKIEPYFQQEGNRVQVGVKVENLTGFNFVLSAGSPTDFDVFTVEGERVWPIPDWNLIGPAVVTFGVFYADRNNGTIVTIEDLQPGEYYAKVRTSKWVEAYGNYNRKIRIFDNLMVPFTVK